MSANFPPGFGFSTPSGLPTSITSAPFINSLRVPDLEWTANGVIRAVGPIPVEDFTGGAASFPSAAIVGEATYQWRRMTVFAGIGFYVNVQAPNVLAGHSPATFRALFKIPAPITNVRFFAGFRVNGTPTNVDVQAGAAQRFAMVRFSTVAGDTGFRPTIWDGTTQIANASQLLTVVADRIYELTIEKVVTVGAALCTFNFAMRDSLGNQASINGVSSNSAAWLTQADTTGDGIMLDLFTTDAVAKILDRALFGVQFGRSTLP